MKLFLFAIILVAVCFSGCGTDGFQRLNFYDEATGQCNPNGLTGPYIDNDNDGLVDCTLLGTGTPIFFTNTDEEALSKRRIYLHYLIDSQYIAWQNKTPEQLKDLIQNCKGELYVAPDGCTGTELLPYPGGFAIWVTRGSETGKFSQAEYEKLYKPKTPRRPEEARLKKRIKTKSTDDPVALKHLCSKPAIQKFEEMQIILYYDCNRDGQLDEYYHMHFPIAGAKSGGSEIWYNLTDNCSTDQGQVCVARTSDIGREMQRRFRLNLEEKRTGGP